MPNALGVKTPNDIPDDKIRGKKIELRVDYNVPLNDRQEVTDKSKLYDSKQSVDYVLEKGGIPVLCSHLGRPDGKKNGSMSLLPVVSHLEGILEKRVIFIPDCIGEERDKTIRSLQPGQIALLENVRFYEGEEKNDPEFARLLAKENEIFINDAMGTAHRGHASNVGVIDCVGLDNSYMGFDLYGQAIRLNQYISNPKRPIALISGGAKVKDKLKYLSFNADIFVCVGLMGLTIIKGVRSDENVGSLPQTIKEKQFKDAAEAYNKITCEGKTFILPVDGKVLCPDGSTPEKRIGCLEPDDVIFDIGEETYYSIASALRNAGTIVWNGLPGKAEDTRFKRGTMRLAKLFTQLARENQTLIIICGGDTSGLIPEPWMEIIAKNGGCRMTAGGAAIEYLMYGTLPAIRALQEK